ncbi:diguanylate cyclase [Acetobacter estunensis NRIC 0472]|uniref:EAL domain-containing protein n=1 Tax=Acetobacter estunensis TaxID=104097 RepID=A0A967ECQ3_9PROT|nr:GGDEF domain-containing phosphodiesterase [Acetobacter estunensis]NHO53170.1 EAL domain-containing protein [Acetobacter estunensis]GBQ24914.1 diguanylate cyclase [Acetobacter estunensis NRIC 0472]
MNDTSSLPTDEGPLLTLLVRCAAQLLPCDVACVLGSVEQDEQPIVLSHSKPVRLPPFAQLKEAMDASVDQLAAGNGVKAGQFAEKVGEFSAWVCKPLRDGKDDSSPFLLCLNRSEQPFPSSALTRLASLSLPAVSGLRPPVPGSSGIADLMRYLDTRITNPGISTATPLALLRIDLARIGPINDSDGWPVSDALIGQAHDILHATTPDSCFTVHLGGGSFAVVVPLEQQNVEAANELATTIVARMEAAHSRPENSFPLEPHIGWAAFPFDAPDTDTLIGFANAALAGIRGQRGGTRVNRVAPEIGKVHAERVGLEGDLRHAIAEGHFRLNWLPVLETATEHVIAFEALVRWDRNGHGEVNPLVFLDCAESTGLIEDIDTWVLHHACQQATTWTQPLGLSINVSPSWLETERVAASIGSALEKSGLEPARLQIELSERSGFDRPDIARKELARIRAMGVRLVLDDFGTGFGALEKLTNYPFDQVKLDRVFIRRLGRDSRVETILRSTIYMIHALNMSCCAEGVETEEQLGFLDAHGCEEIQGYLIGRPSVQPPR